MLKKYELQDMKFLCFEEYQQSQIQVIVWYECKGLLKYLTSFVSLP